jgi:hypothetical protein
VRIKQALISGDLDKGRHQAISLVLKSGGDVRAVVLLADACLFSQEPSEAKRWYNQAIEKNSISSKLMENDRRFLGAYISTRLLECSFLQDKESNVAGASIWEAINEMPAGVSLKALFCIDSDQKSVPRRYDSRTRRKRETHLR